MVYEHPPKPFGVVTWDDAHGSAADEMSETELERKHKGITYVSYGWIVRTNEAGVTLAAEWCPEDKKYRATMFIPRGMVATEETLTLVKPRRKKTPVAV